MNHHSPNLKKATFAGGCFWCVEADFEKTDGVVAVVSGYAGGTEPDPTYEQVCSGRTGHLEVVQVTYDPERIDYTRLLDLFWRHVDPTDPGGQFVDRGPQYQTAIFYHDEVQRQLAETSRERLNRSGRLGKPIVTEIRSMTRFHPAEEYHQDFHRKSPQRYTAYRAHSGRDAFLRRMWGERKPETEPPESPRPYGRPNDEILKSRLTPLQYKVTQKAGTEPPFQNAYWNSREPGIYVDAVSGEPLFSSLDKFDSGTGWPSFTRPLAPDNVVEREDRTLWMVRTEVRSRFGDSHLGHVFPDGPRPTGRRYCINSAALRFIPAAELAAEGYGEYAGFFDQTE